MRTAISHSFPHIPTEAPLSEKCLCLCVSSRKQVNAVEHFHANRAKKHSKLTYFAVLSEMGELQSVPGSQNAATRERGSPAHLHNNHICGFSQNQIDYFS